MTGETFTQFVAELAQDDTELDMLRRLEDLVRRIDSTRRGCTTWPEVREILHRLEDWRRVAQRPSRKS